MAKKNNLKKWFNKNFSSLKNKKLIKKIETINYKNNRVFFAIDNNITENTLINEKLNKAKEFTVDRKKIKKKRWLKFSFFLLNVALIFGVFYSFAHEQGGIQPLNTLFANSPKWSLLFIALGLFIITNIFNALKFAILIFNKTKKFRPFYSLKLAVIGRYYDLITPMGSGGQPFEIYQLKKNGYSGDVATAIPLAKYLVWQVSFAILCTIVLLSYSHKVNSTLVIVLAWIGLCAVLLLFLFVLFMSITKRFGASLVVGVLKLLHKMHIIKDYRKTLRKVLTFVKQYQYCMKSFAKSPLTVIGEVLVTTGSIVCNAIIAYFVLGAFSTNLTVSMWDILCKCCICEVACCFVPLPGGSGATELSFNALLGSLFPTGTLFWGILIWRLLTYYLYIFQGAFLIIFDAIFSKTKKHQSNNMVKENPTTNINKNTEDSHKLEI